VLRGLVLEVLGVDVVGEVFGLTDGLAVLLVASGLEVLGVDVVGEVFGLTDGLAVLLVASGLVLEVLGVDVEGAEQLQDVVGALVPVGFRVGL
jgi:hypothetical protein